MRTSILLVLLLLFASACVHAQVVVIANRSVPESALTPAQVLDMYLLNTRTWSDGQVVSLTCLRENMDEEREFYGLLQRTPLEMRKIWLRAQLSGQARPPEMIMSQEELVRRVASTPGAIGFVRREKVQGNVKILLVLE
jgi:ABC-type phosphate transport system substrate-binding protein